MILTIDQGTTGTTTLLVDAEGQVRRKAYRELPQSYPQPGWVEHDPEAIWKTVLETCGEVADGSLPPSAIGITNQRETLVVWDRGSGRPVAPAIVWQDRRTADICNELKAAGKNKSVRAKTGLLLDPYFSGTKLLWLFRENPSLRRRAERGELAAGTIDSWLIWKLTGGDVHATDVTNASRTLLLNLESLDWDETLLEILETPRSILPEVRPSISDYGVTIDGPWGSGIPICGVAGDQQSALFGQGCFHAGFAKNTYGTGCFLLCHRGGDASVSDSPVLTTAAASPDGKPAYALEGSVFVAGAAVQWLRDELGVIASSEESETLARTVDDSGGITVVPAFTGLGAPHWNPDARGAVLGLSRGSTAAQIVRATLEGIAFQVADLVSIPELGGHLRELRVDGGACRNNLLMQIQADVLGIPITRPTNIETTAMGAACLAGLGAGIWSSADDLEQIRRIDRTFEPQIGEDERQTRIAAWKKAVERVLS